MKIWQKEYVDDAPLVYPQTEVDLFGVSLGPGKPWGDRYPEDLSFIHSNEFSVADYIDCYEFFLVTPQLREIISRFESLIDWYPVQINHKENKTFSEYYILNALNIVDCFDPNESTYEPKKDYFTSIRKIRVLESKVGSDSHFFYIRNTSLPIYGVSGKLASELSSRNFSGFSLVRDKEYINSAYPLG